MKNKILLITRTTIPYVKELRPLAGSVTACLIMQQLDYWFAKYPDGFYKFMEPCDHPDCEEGKSWTEEIGCSAEEFLAAFDNIGVRYKSKSAFKEAADKFQERFNCSYYDRQERRTWYFRNHQLLDAALDELIGGQGGQPADGEPCSDEGSSPRNRQTRFLGNRHRRVLGNQESRFPGNHQTRFPGDRESRDLEADKDGFSETDSAGFSYITEITSPEITREHTQTQVESPVNSATVRPLAGGGVGVCFKSVYTPEEIYRYVMHCKESGQQIPNPQGLAITLHRTGEADAFIKAYLCPEPSSPPPTTVPDPQCPKCFGCGMEVVPGKGARRCQCRHRGHRDPPGAAPVDHGRRRDALAPS